MWASVHRAETLGQLHGFRTHAVDLRDINETVMVDLDGHGETIEVYFKLSPTGYLAYHRTFIHEGIRGTWWRSWNQTAHLIASFDDD